MLAEWLGVPQRELSITSSEAATWPDGCLGAARAGDACAAVVTRGYRVRFTDARGGRHTVHTGDAEAVAWAGEVAERGRVAGFDAARQRLTLVTPRGEVVLQAVPGTTWRIERGTAAGAMVVVGIDPGAANAPPTLAWIARDSAQ